MARKSSSCRTFIFALAISDIVAFVAGVANVVFLWTFHENDVTNYGLWFNAKSFFLRVVLEMFKWRIEEVVFSLTKRLNINGLIEDDYLCYWSPEKDCCWVPQTWEGMLLDSNHFLIYVGIKSAHWLTNVDSLLHLNGLILVKSTNISVSNKKRRYEIHFAVSLCSKCLTDWKLRVWTSQSVDPKTFQSW